MRKRGVFALEQIPIWVIALFVLALAVILILLLREKSTGSLDFLKGLLRFGR